MQEKAEVIPECELVPLLQAKGSAEETLILKHVVRPAHHMSLCWWRFGQSCQLYVPEAFWHCLRATWWVTYAQRAAQASWPGGLLRSSWLGLCRSMLHHRQQSPL